MITTITGFSARVFTGVAVALFALMSVGPIAGGADAATTLTLLVMHVVVAVPVFVLILPALRTLSPDNTTAETTPTFV